MANPRIGILLLVAAAGLPAQAAAAPQPAPAPRVYAAYEDGRTAAVEVLELRGDTVRLRSQLYDGHVVFLAHLDQFTPITRYRFLIATSRPQSHAEHLAVARRAGEWRLLEPTAQHLRSAWLAAQGSPDATAKQQEASAWAAAWLDELVRESLAAGDVAEADRRLELLSTRLPGHCAEERLEELAARIDARRAEREAEQRRTRQARLAEQARRDIERRMQPIAAQVDTGDKRLREAMRNSRRTVETTRLAGAALDAYRSAWTAAQELLKRHPDHDELAAELGALAITLRERSVRAALHAASAQTMQSDFRSAMTWVDRALEVDPDSRDAKELRQTILVASAAAGGFGWGWAPLPAPASQR